MSDSDRLQNHLNLEAVAKTLKSRSGSISPYVNTEYTESPTILIQWKKDPQKSKLLITNYTGGLGIGLWPNKVYTFTCLLISLSLINHF